MKCAILGYGVVGSGAYEFLQRHGNTVKKVLDIRPHAELGDKLTSDFNEILNDEEITVVAEAIGGLEPAHTFAVQALKAKKSVVSSNKHLICTYFDELHTLAKENGVSLRYTSASGGGIPWLYNLKRTARIDNILKIKGILNGTTNFILDAMISERRDFDDVLKEAQALGYAEQNPSADIDGLDTARKVAISSSLAYNTIVEEKDVCLFSLRNILPIDIDFVQKVLFKSVRYLGYGLRTENGVCTFVEPTVISLESQEAHVLKNNNCISLVGDGIGTLTFIGQGAGKEPTGHALASDVLDILSGLDSFAYAPNVLPCDTTAKRAYYVRTQADVSLPYSFKKTENGYTLLITEPMEVGAMHEVANEILKKDGKAFFAGIED